MKFFRKIRLNSIVQGKTANYIKYATGEILLVVIGILIALQVNNLNEERKREIKRQELINSLIIDFETSLTKSQESLKETDKLIKNMDLFSDLLQSKNQVSVDSLKSLATAFFRMISFEPSLTFYSQAKNNGDLELLESKDFFVKVNQFEDRNTMQKKLMDNFLQGYSTGYIWELRKSVGSINNLKKDSSSSFFWVQSNTETHQEYYDLMTSPLAIAAMQTHKVLNESLRVDLILLERLSNEILTILKEEIEVDK